MHPETCSEKTFREMAESHVVTSVCLLGLAGGFAVSFHVGDAERRMASTRGGIRLFKLAAGADFLRKNGFPRFMVDTANFREGHIRKPRPDRSQALRKTRTRLKQADFLDRVGASKKAERKGEV